MELKKYYYSLLAYRGQICNEEVPYNNLPQDMKKAIDNHIKRQRKAKGQKMGKTFLEWLELVQWIRTTKQTPEKVAGLVYDWVMNRFWKQLFLGIALGAIGTIIAVVIGKFLL